MVPFSEADSDRFFGRDREVEELLQSLRLHRFLAVIGPSGSGKSSLVLAGLIPALRRSGLFGTGGWAIRIIRPGERPMMALAEALGGDPADLARVVAKAIESEPDARRLLLVVDQFEELFTVAHTDAVAFQHALRHLAETTRRLRDLDRPRRLLSRLDGRTAVAGDSGASRGGGASGQRGITPSDRPPGRGRRGVCRGSPR